MGLISRLFKGDQPRPRSQPDLPAEDVVWLGMDDDWGTVTLEAFQGVPLKDDPAVIGNGLNLASDRGILPWRAAGFTQWPDRGIYTLKVVGESYRATDVERGSFAAGSPLRLIPEPDNEHDPNAIGIWDQQGRHQCGYVPSRATRSVRQVIGDGNVHIFVTSEWLKASRRVSVKAAIVRPGAIVAGLPEGLPLHGPLP